MSDFDHRRKENHKPFAKPHEIVSAMMACQLLKDQPGVSFEFIVRCIIGLRYTSENEARCLNALIDLINGNHDVDKMDYLTRSQIRMRKTYDAKHDFANYYLDARSIKSIKRLGVLKVDQEKIEPTPNVFFFDKLKGAKEAETTYISDEKNFNDMLSRLLAKAKQKFSTFFLEFYDPFTSVIKHKDHILSSFSSNRFDDSMIDALLRWMVNNKIVDAKDVQNLIAEYNKKMPNWSFDF